MAIYCPCQLQSLESRRDQPEEVKGRGHQSCFWRIDLGAFDGRALKGRDDRANGSDGFLLNGPADGFFAFTLRVNQYDFFPLLPYF